MKLSLIGLALTSVIITPAVFAKMTLEEAMRQNEPYMNKQYTKRYATEPIDLDAINDGYSPTNGEWRTIFSGSTTGSVNIPSNATEVYIVSTEGARMFPRNSSYVELGSVTKVGSTSYVPECVVATAKGTYSNGVVKGASVKRSGRCKSSSNHDSTVRVTATFEIKSVMVK